MIDCERLNLSRCHDCPDTCALTGGPVDEEDCIDCQSERERERVAELREDCRRDEGEI